MLDEAPGKGALSVVGRVGLIMALALLGDALLYLALPAYAARLGLPLWTVGILLSVNRLVRLITNGGAAVAFKRFSRRSVMIGGTILTVATSALYGLTTFLPVLLLARAGWGACFSVLRLGGLMTVLTNSTPRTRGRLVGLYQSISRSGPMLGVALGGFALERLGYGPTFLVMAAVSALAIPLAWGLPQVRETEGPEGATPWRAMVFGGHRLVAVKTAALVNGLSFHGIVTPTIVLALVEAGRTSGATELAGILVSLRSGSDMALAAPLGYLSDRIGRSRALPLFLALEGLATLALAFGLASGVTVVVVTLLTLFVLSTGVGTVADATAGDLAQPHQRAQVMSSYATWLDLGAAIGPAVGLAFVGAVGLRVTYLGAAVILLAATLHFWWVARAYPWSALVTDGVLTAD
ncbi:MAG: MFS transporter [Anaerolineae bacterium]|nr:MFS transporter [Anaerolineae bacterium]